MVSSAATTAATCAGKNGSFFFRGQKRAKNERGLSLLIRTRLSPADGNRIINCPSRRSRSLLGNVIGDFFMEGGK